ncbi:MAG: TonB-dependent receptor, partial [Sphingomonadales bacterium]|nr:TonB-dependent receptor [Sphingomonadales bacterium]
IHLDDCGLAKTGISNIGDALNQLPSFRQVTSPATNLYRQSTNTAARTMDLRGLGDSRTLVLVDGRRFVPSSELGTVDLNAIPSALIARAEVVTGGASAAYGANAVAGVVNLILDTKLTGIKGEISYGSSEKGDAQSYNASLAAGFGFGGGRGHAVVGGEYVNEKPAGDCFTRDWCDSSIQLIQNPGFSTNPALSNGLPATLLLDNVWSILNPGGVIVSGPLRGTTFDKQGNPVPFQFGNLVSGTSMVGGDASVGKSLLTEHVPLKTANRHIAAFGHANYDLTDALRIVGELSYSEVHGGPTQGSNGYDFSTANNLNVNDALLASGGSGLRIKIDNAYLPAATRNAMIAAGVATIPINKLYRELNPSLGTSTSETIRAMIGLNGDFIGGWKWDAYYQYGRTTSRLDIVGLRHNARFAQATDAVLAPNGSIVCRSALTSPNNGCVPFNVFGETNASNAAVAYVTGNAWAERRIVQHAAAVNLRGDLFETWAGPVAAAAGAEYRRDRSRGDADATSRASGWNSNSAFPLPADGDKTVEGYLEVSVPLLKDMAFAKSFNVDGAIRQTHTDKTGSATTWKIGAVYQISDDYMLRVTRSRDIRAPSALELSPASNTVNLPVNDPNPATAGTYYVNLTTGGNPNLAPEKANTFTIGAVIKPSWIKGLNLSVDYYNIKVERAIAVLTGQQTVNLCSQGNTTVCPFITRNASGQITQVFSTYQNLSSLHSEGLEFVGDYLIDLQDISSSLGGKLDLSVNATYTIKLSTTDATGFVTRYDGWTGNPGTVQSVAGVPKWRADGLITYSTDRFSLSAHGRYVGPGVYDPTKVGPEEAGYSPNRANSINYNRVASRLYWDLSSSIDLMNDGNRKVQLFGSIYNLFDKAPPRLRLYGNPVLFDAIGRSYRIGLRTVF